MGGHATSTFSNALSVGAGVAAVINPVSAGAMVAGQLSGSSVLGNTAAIAANPLAGSAGALTNTITAGVPKPQVPDAIPQTSQAQAAVDSVGGRNMTLAQQMAMTAGGTLFNTPRQSWGQPMISNNGGGGRALLGA